MKLTGHLLLRMAFTPVKGIPKISFRHLESKEMWIPLIRDPIYDLLLDRYM